MKSIYLIQLQNKSTKEQPSQPVAVSCDKLVDFINEHLSPSVVMLISSVDYYGRSEEE